MIRRAPLTLIFTLVIGSIATATDAVSSLMARPRGPTRVIEDLKELCDRLAGFQIRRQRERLKNLPGERESVGRGLRSTYTVNHFVG